MPGIFVFSPERLRALREGQPMSREQLAINAGCSYPAVALYETGHRVPSHDMLDRLAAALGVEPDDLGAEG